MLRFLTRLFPPRASKSHVSSAAAQMGTAFGAQDFFEEQSAGLQRPYEQEARRIENQVNRISHLKRGGEYEAALGFLLAEIDLQERDSRSLPNHGVAPWYYWEAAILYRKLKRYDDEVAIIERFSKQVQAPGARPAKILARLDKAKELAARAAASSGSSVK